LGPLKAGDRLDVSIDGLGVLSNTFAAAPKPS
jgi:2-keto-4-pentenoate hydratase/2-oxohepta-3-ene-1,7-dioic acid hydratase in catechol pathway